LILANATTGGQANPEANPYYDQKNFCKTQSWLLVGKNLGNRIDWLLISENYSTPDKPEQRSRESGYAGGVSVHSISSEFRNKPTHNSLNPIQTLFDGLNIQEYNQPV
jgi:hypothetical protein